MSAAVRSLDEVSEFEQLRLARDILRQEAEAVQLLCSFLDTQFCRAVKLLLACRGSAVVTGIGKAGLVAQKLAATLASTGTRSHFLHPSEALHGDLGRVAAEDCVVALSKSGESEEIRRLLPSLAGFGTPIVALTAVPCSTLGRSATVVLNLGTLREACPLNLAPSTSTTAMMALGDALALVASRLRGFRREDFARFHPGGSLGRQLANVEEVMRPLDQCRVASDQKSVRQVIVEASRPGRRTGAIILTNPRGEVSGIFTDSDLARLLESHQDGALDAKIHSVMTSSPKTVPAGVRLTEAIQMLQAHRISELPIVDALGQPLGLLDITDVLAFPTAPRGSADASAGQTAPPMTLPLPPRA